MGEELKGTLESNRMTREDHVQQRHSVGEPHSFWNVGFENNSWGGIQKMLDREYRVKVLGCFAKIKIYI